MSPRVFLSAGVPHGDRADAYAPYDPEAILDAVVWVARILLRRGAHLVTGAQPAISPVLLKIAPEAAEGLSVHIFQSEVFRPLVPQETLALEQNGHGRIEWIGAEPEDLVPEALARMRRAMLEGPLDAGIFIGGMNGVEDEFVLFRDIHREAPVFVLAGPGGAARGLADDPEVTSWRGGEYPRYAMDIADGLGLGPASRP